MKTRINFEMESGFYIQAALLLLVLPLRWTLGAMLAVALHELGHLLALHVLKIPIKRISVFAYGVRIYADGMPSWKEMLASIAGPIGSIIVILLLPVFPEASVCACVHTAFNLIPMYPFDGGRTVCAVCRILFGNIVGYNIMKVIQIVTCLCMFLFCAAAVRYIGLIALLPIFSMIKGANILPSKRYALDKWIPGVKLGTKERQEGSL